jgi:serine protease
VNPSPDPVPARTTPCADTRLSILPALALLLASPLSAGEYRSRPASSVVPGEYLVTFDPAAVSELRVAADVATASLAHGVAGRHRGAVERVFRHALHGALIRLPDEAAARAMAARPDVLRVEPNGRVHALATQTGATWGLDRIDQRNLPLAGGYSYGTTASNVHVYVVDTGVATGHADFGGRAVHGIDTEDEDYNASDCNGHGTHVAGTVAGSTWGVAKGARIVAVRVLDCEGSGTDAGVIAGIDWVTAHHVKPAVANLSLGGDPSSSIDAAIRGSIAAGVTYVVAAGNESESACNSSPARVAEAITVGATTASDARASFSNYGSCVDLFAPGASIRSAWHTSATAASTLSGTSMASPHVAGAAALYLAANPSASPAQVANALLSNATAGKVTSAGSGSPNRLLYTLASGGSTPDPAPTGDTALGNDVPLAVADSANGQKFFYLDVPAGQSNLTITIAGGSGDGDLYVRSGAKPTLTSWACRPYKEGNAETCSFANPGAGRWWVMLDAYTAYSTTLRARFTAPGGGGGGTGGCAGPLYTGSLSSGKSVYLPSPYYQSTATGTHVGALDGPSGADFDLYLQRWNGSSWSTVRSGTSESDNESVTWSGNSGYYRWRVHAYSGSGSFSLCTRRP